MITLDISQAVFFYLMFTVVGVLAAWVFFGGKGKFTANDEDRYCVWQCGICTHTYIDSRNSEISKCPLCSSLNERKIGGNDD